VKYRSKPIDQDVLKMLENFGHKSFAEQADIVQDLADDFLVRHSDWVAFAQEKDASLKEKYTDKAILKEELRTYPGLKAVAAHEAAHAFYELGTEHQPNARAISEAAASLTGADIHPGANIDPYVFIDHAKGVVIGETASIGQGTQVFHGVTLGAVGHSKGGSEHRHPQIGQDVVLSADTQIMGSEHVGDGALIGPASQIIKSEVGAGVVMKPNTHISDIAVEARKVLMPEGQSIITSMRGASLSDERKQALDSHVSPQFLDVSDVTNKVIDSLQRR